MNQIGSIMNFQVQLGAIKVLGKECPFKYVKQSEADRWDFKSHTYLEEQSIKLMHSALWINSAQ